ncbi:hypothetical protein ACF1GY_36475 [Streptomyces sp. NPDC014684]|uniref:hypothetical protein n=1 Tax=Streptomyces sp. NPDC014684 TaxID=3364880 RepID=UPI0036FD4C14
MTQMQLQASTRQRQGWTNLATVLLVQLGAFLFVVGWLVGVLLLWASDQWRLRDKVIGTVLIPGGLAVPIFLTFSPERCTTVIEGGIVRSEQCGHLSYVPWLDTTLLILLWVVSLISASWLVHSAREPEIDNPRSFLT